MTAGLAGRVGHAGDWPGTDMSCAYGAKVDAGMDAESAHYDPGGAARPFTIRQHSDGRGTLVVSLSGRLCISDVEALAECADRICGLPVPRVRIELGALAAVDDAGARTLSAACHCLRLHGRRVDVRGVRHEVRRTLDRLGLTLAELNARVLPA
jgi:anti-anti-sigma regulatory factor